MPSTKPTTRAPQPPNNFDERVPSPADRAQILIDETNLVTTQSLRQHDITPFPKRLAPQSDETKSQSSTTLKVHIEQDLTQPNSMVGSDLVDAKPCKHTPCTITEHVACLSSRSNPTTLRNRCIRLAPTLNVLGFNNYQLTNRKAKHQQ